MPTLKLMLAAKLEDPSKLTFPVYASPKLDGIRAVVLDGVVYSRNMKPIPNRFIQEKLGKLSYNRLDGELIVGDPTAPDVFRTTTSGVMSEDGEPDFLFYAFDSIQTTPAHGFGERLRRVKSFEKAAFIEPVEHVVVNSAIALEHYEEKCLTRGYEGVMVRSINGPYKHGRSTEREGYLLKLKRFEDAEAVVREVVELQHNGNAKGADGKRTSHKAGKTGLDTMGALRVVGAAGSPYSGVEFEIGTGFTANERKLLWEKPPYGRTVKFKFFPLGSKDRPRFPVFLGFRDDL